MPFRSKINVIHEGIDTNFLIPNDNVIINLEDGKINVGNKVKLNH